MFGFGNVCSLLLPNNSYQSIKPKAAGLQHLCFLTIWDLAPGINNHCVAKGIFFAYFLFYFSKMFIEQDVKTNFILYTARLQTASETGISCSHMPRGEFVH